MKVEVNGTFVEIPDELAKTFNEMTVLEQGTSLCKLLGMSNRDAYYAGGGTATSISSADACAARVLGTNRCKAFITGCRNLQLAANIMSREEMAARLSEMARTRIDDVVEFHETDGHYVDGETGEAVKPQSLWSVKRQDEMSGGGLAAISELTAGKEGLKVKMHDQKAAMKLLSDLMGYNKPQEVKVTTSLTLDDLYDSFEDEDD